MKYIIESMKEYNFETEEVIRKVNKRKYIDLYESLTLEELKSAKSLPKGYIPIGSIGFVEAYLSATEGFSHENPIEVPEYLRTDEFLKRSYRIVGRKDLPKRGTYFIKDVSNLKSFGSVVNTEFFFQDDMFEEASSKFDTTLRFSPDTRFLVSSVFDIKAEYRVYVIDRVLENISLYNGSPIYQPDISLINKAISEINSNEEWLKSYTLDIMVGDSGTAVIEVHNFASVGLYSTLWGDNLLYAYRQGIDYLLNDNRVRV